jgi:hypothetical protein
MLIKSKSDIFTRDFYTLPFFYTFEFTLYISMLYIITALLSS